ncbi:hypothetical protein EJ110_NYTH58660 [Nymphaea thermarum]|nr:hypothetical protein EJ110_NYTH58660 [Nymphaea thermarum]
MRVFGTLNRHKVLILLDCGATNNFLNTEAAKRCNVQLEPSPPQTIIVGNGARISSTHEGKDIEVVIRKKPFKIDLIVCPVDGADLILGMTWLATLGVVAWDFKNLKMTFTQEGDTESVTLMGLASTFLWVQTQARAHHGRPTAERQPPWWPITVCIHFICCSGRPLIHGCVNSKERYSVFPRTPRLGRREPKLHAQHTTVPWGLAPPALRTGETSGKTKRGRLPIT